MSRPLSAAFWVSLGFVFLTTSASVAQEAPEVVAFENVTVLPMDGERILPSQTVIVRGRRIAELGPAASLRVPEGALRIDGRGKFLMPGLAEMHGHLPGPQAIEQLGADYLDRVLFLFVANGVTTVRGMLGVPLHLQVKAEIARGERWGPQVFTTGPSLNGASVPTREAAWRMVTEQRASGYDLLKIHPGIQREVYDEMARTARREGIPFAGHVPADVGLERVMISGQASVDHLDGYAEALVKDGVTPSGTPGFFGLDWVDSLDESKLPALAAATRAAGLWNVPTQVLIENRYAEDSLEERARRPEMRYVPARMMEQWMKAVKDETAQPGFSAERARRFVELRRRVIKALRDAGAGILLGADTPQVFNVPGFATLQELSALVAAGLTPYEALEAGTRNPARYFGLEASFGTVAVGKRADLLLLTANPLIDIASVRQRAGVMLAGRWLPAEEIERRLAAFVGGS
jgi:cytosine/adenosine deaminase-related metal-dependent hydrolase